MEKPSLFLLLSSNNNKFKYTTNFTIFFITIEITAYNWCMIIMSVEQSLKNDVAATNHNLLPQQIVKKDVKICCICSTLVTLESNGAFLWKGRKSFMICTVVIIHAVLPNPYEHLSLPGIQLTESWIVPPIRRAICPAKTCISSPETSVDLVVSEGSYEWGL